MLPVAHWTPRRLQGVDKIFDNGCLPWAACRFEELNDDMKCNQQVFPEWTYVQPTGNISIRLMLLRELRFGDDTAARVGPYTSSLQLQLILG